MSRLVTPNHATGWRHLSLIILNSQIPAIAAGALLHMTAAEKANAHVIANNWYGNIVTMSKGYTAPSHTIIEASEALTSATPNSGLWYVGPSDAANIRTAHNADTYDSVSAFVSNSAVPCNFAGLTEAGAPGWSHIAAADNGTFGQPWLMIQVHEWLHQVTSFYAGLGFPQPNIDNGANYSALDGSDFGSAWDFKAFLAAVLTGVCRDKTTGQQCGVTPAAWAAGRPVT